MGKRSLILHISFLGLDSFNRPNYLPFQRGEKAVMFFFLCMSDGCTTKKNNPYSFVIHNTFNLFLHKTNFCLIINALTLLMCRVSQ